VLAIEGLHADGSPPTSTRCSLPAFA
jgi:hypothetical protein